MSVALRATWTAPLVQPLGLVVALVVGAVASIHSGFETVALLLPAPSTT